MWPWSAYRCGRMAVLLVEDEPSLRALISEWLRRSSYTVLVAENGLEAIQMAKQHCGNIETVVTDFSMPGISGIELVRELRKLRPDLRAILLTGYRIHPLPKDLGIEFISKPCSASTLLEAIGRAA